VRVALLVLALLCTGCGAVDAEVGSREPLERYGIAVTPPPGWNARLTRGTVEAAHVALGSLGQKPALGPDDLYVQLFEYEPGPQATAADLARNYANGRPEPFRAAEFGPSGLPGENPDNHGWARRYFLLAGRYFDLFVEAGALAPPGEVVVELNAIVGSLEVRRGDFYPGSVEPPRFLATDGWYIGSADGGEVRATDYAEAWAATVPYRNGPRDLPPSRTLETLSPDGIVIWVGLARDNRFPPTAERRGNRPPLHVPLRLSNAHGCACFEGVPDNWVYRLYGPVGEQYDLDLWVFFGRVDEPSAEERNRAQAVLDRLELPDWGPWELDGRGAVAAS
jgi:hypothetical protein